MPRGQCYQVAAVVSYILVVWHKEDLLQVDDDDGAHQSVTASSSKIRRLPTTCTTRKALI